LSILSSLARAALADDGIVVSTSLIHAETEFQ
jgi:hypothetical protein